METSLQDSCVVIKVSRVYYGVLLKSTKLNFLYRYNPLICCNFNYCTHIGIGNTGIPETSAAQIDDGFDALMGV